MKLAVKVLLTFTAFLLITPYRTFALTHTSDDAQQFSEKLEAFGLRLFAELTKANPQKNIVFSTFAIQTGLAMARLGADNQTADEIDKVLGLTAGQKPEELAKSHHDILEKYENSSILKTANKIFIMFGYEVKQQFDDLLTENFFSWVDAIDFSDSKTAARLINSWVESRTNHMTKNLIGPQLLSNNTRMLLVNAINFKCEWEHQFDELATRKSDFYLDASNTVKVEMMETRHDFKYGTFPEFDAAALQMPYKDSNFSLLIILPNSRNGLADVVDKLKYVPLSYLTQRMLSTKVAVKMPKFKIEFETEMSSALINLGLRRMFSSDAEFGKMLKLPKALRVSAVMHKTSIEVNEKGNEAADATGQTIVYGGLWFSLFERRPQQFNANKPFYYALMDKDGLVILEGSVLKF